MKEFKPRFLTTEFLKVLKTQAEHGGWWRDVLDDPELLIMVRENYLSVYFLGGAVFKKIEVVGETRGEPTLKGTLDRSYLASGETYDGDNFDVSLQGTSFTRVRKPPKTNYASKYTKDSLGLIKRNISRRWRDTHERSGVYNIAMNNPHVIDIELAMPGEYAGASTNNPQVDIVALEQDADDVSLAFWESKCRKSTELTDRGAKRHVVQQMKEYRDAAKRNAHLLEVGYAKLVSNLIEIQKMRKTVRRTHALCERVNEGAAIKLGVEPKAGLIVFGSGAEAWASSDSGRRVKEAIRSSRTEPTTLISDDPKAIVIPH